MASTPDDFQLRNPFFRTPFLDCSRSYWEGVEKTATLSGQSAKTKLPQTLRGLAGCLAKPPRGWEKLFFFLGHFRFLKNPGRVHRPVLDSSLEMIELSTNSPLYRAYYEERNSRGPAPVL